MVLARLPFYPGPACCGERRASLVHWHQDREAAARRALVAAGACAERLAGLRGSQARPVLAAEVALAHCQAGLRGLEARSGVRSSSFRGAFSVSGSLG